MNYQPYLTTLDMMRSLGDLGTQSNEDSDATNAVLLDYIQEASQIMLTELKRIPVPYYDTRTFDYGVPYRQRDLPYYGSDVVMPDFYRLFPKADLLEVDTLTNVTVIASSDYVLDPRNEYPKHTIRLKSESDARWTYTDTPEDAVSVAGWWGYVPHYDQAWPDSGSTMPAGDTASSTSIVVTGTDLGFERYQYIKVNDEILLITDISESTDTTLTVQRGELGTTATGHTSGDTIRRYRHIRDIQGATTELARYMYKTRNDLGNNVQVFEGGVLTVRDIDKRVDRAIKRHRRSYY